MSRVGFVQIIYAYWEGCHDSIQLGHDPIDPIHYPFVQTNTITTKIYDSECHLNDLLNKHIDEQNNDE